MNIFNMYSKKILERLFLFSMSAIAFLTVFGTVIAPLPIIYTFKRMGRAWGALALFVNTLIVLATAGKLPSLVFLVVVGTISVGIAEISRFKTSVEKIVIGSLMGVLLLGSASVITMSLKQNMSPINHVTVLTQNWVDSISTQIKEQKIKLPENTAVDLLVNDPKEAARSILIEFPSAFIIGALLVILLNLILILTINPNNLWEKLELPQDFFRTWSAPAHLVWGVIASGIFLVFKVPYASPIALNVFKILMALYFFHGLSIVYFILESYKVTVFWKALIYGLLIFIFMPLLLSLGFFDLWFDFRAKFSKRESSGGNDESDFD